MEFHEKLQELRKVKGLTQEELAESLYVSRTAVSKWESGRGYPNIDSLKAIAKYFSVTVDELLSGDELLTIAEDDAKEKEKRCCDQVFGLLDLSAVMFFFLPFFGQKTAGGAEAVSLLALTGISPWLRGVYFAAVTVMALLGLCALALQNCGRTFWLRNKGRISLVCNAAAVLLFVVSLQPYAAVLLFVFLAIKANMLIRKK